MENNHKKQMKVFGEIAVVAVMLFFLYYIFKDSYKGILAQLEKTNIGIFLVMLFLGNLYFFVDAFVYWNLFRHEGFHINYPRCVAIAYMSVFFNVTTFGAGIKPAQVLYLTRKGIDPGKGFSIVTMPYIFQKTVIVVYALVMLALNNSFVVKNFKGTFGYIYMGAGFSVLIIAFIILVCASEKFHGLVFKLISLFFKSEKHSRMKELLRVQIDGLREGTQKIIKNPKAWLAFCGAFIIKMSCWYVIPAIALYASGGSLGGVNFAQALTMTALMQLLMGVIPTSGGVGSLEVVFSLLFAAVFGEVMAGACMVLYRLSTYYLPFILSVGIMLVIGKDLKKEKIEIPLEPLEFK